MTIRLDPVVRAQWETLAAERGLSLSEWIRLACDAFARPASDADPRSARTHRKPVTAREQGRVVAFAGYPLGKDPRQPFRPGEGLL